MKKILKKILDIILLPFTVIAVIFAGISILSNFLFTPKLFQKFSQLFPVIFSKKLFIILFLILIVLAGGIFAWQYFGAQKTVDWQTYKNAKYGVEFQYPNFWVLDDKEALSVDLSDQTRNFIQINVSNGTTGREDESMSPCQPGVASVVYQVGKLRDSQQTFEEFVNFQIENPERGAPPEVKPILTPTMVGNRNALKTEGMIDNCTIEFYYVEQNFDRYTTISFIVDKDSDKLIFNQILSTFRFLEIEAVEKKDETADRKTYKNEEYGFEIKYPKDWYYGDNDYENQQMICFNPKGLAGDCTAILTISWNTELQERYAGMKQLFEKDYNVTESVVSVVGTEGKLLTIRSTLGFTKSLFFEKNGYVYNFAMREVGYETLFNQMLSTFRFIEVDKTAELVPSEVEGWQTYRDEEWGVEFQYPPVEMFIEYPGYPLVQKIIFKYYTDETYDTYEEYEGIHIHELRQGCSIRIHKNINPFDEEKYIIPLLASYESIEKNREIFYAGLTVASRAVDVNTCKPIFNQMLSTFRFLE